MTEILRKIGLGSALVGALVGCGGNEFCPDGGEGRYGPASSIDLISSKYDGEKNKATLAIEFQGNNVRWVAVAEGIKNMNKPRLDSLVNEINRRKEEGGRIGVYGNWIYYGDIPTLNLRMDGVGFDTRGRNRVQFCFDNEQNRR